MAPTLGEVVATMLVLVGALQSTAAYPMHASCKVDYSVDVSCQKVSTALITALNDLAGPEGCKHGGEKCNYNLVHYNETTISATHKTPVKEYIDDIIFQLRPPVAQAGRCMIEGYSRSQTWYAFLDFGTNYCNMRNLFERASLTDAAGFQEKTSNSVCTQYSSADCAVY